MASATERNLSKTLSNLKNFIKYFTEYYSNISTLVDLSFTKKNTSTYDSLVIKFMPFIINETVENETLLKRFANEQAGLWKHSVAQFQENCFVCHVTFDWRMNRILNKNYISFIQLPGSSIWFGIAYGHVCEECSKKKREPKEYIRYSTETCRQFIAWMIEQKSYELGESFFPSTSVWKHIEKNLQM